MSIPYSLLALLAERPMYGAELKSEFERRTGSTWPLNVGQVYTTLSRLERDGLVEATGPADADGRITYGLTREGTDQAAAWWTRPVLRDSAPRSELAIKVALAVTSPGVDVAAVLQAQRRATITHLQDLTRLKRAHLAGGESDLAWALVLEHLIFAAEGETRWLDHVEVAVARSGPVPPAAATVPVVGAPHSSDSETAPPTAHGADLGGTR